jgi:hypothetical protein
MYSFGFINKFISFGSAVIPVKITALFTTLPVPMVIRFYGEITM